MFSAWPVKPKASTLVQSLWKACNQIKGTVVLRENKFSIPFLAQDSIWWPLGPIDQFKVQANRARKIYNKGIRCLGDLCDSRYTQTWADEDTLINNYKVNMENT